MGQILAVDVLHREEHVPIDLTDPPKSTQIFKARSGRLQLLAKITRDDTGQAYLELTPHHYKPKADLVPRSPLEKQLDGVKNLSDIAKIVNYEDAGPGGFYDNLGLVGKDPHLVRNKSWEQDPGFVPAMNNLAWNMFEEGEIKEGLELAKKARKVDDENPWLGDTYAWILHKSGDSAGALPILRKAVDALPENKAVRGHLVEVLKAVGRVDEAAEQEEILNASE